MRRRLGCFARSLLLHHEDQPRGRAGMKDKKEIEAKAAKQRRFNNKTAKKKQRKNNSSKTQYLLFPKVCLNKVKWLFVFRTFKKCPSTKATQASGINLLHIKKKSFFSL